jgi:hypothetical protein
MKIIEEFHEFTWDMIRALPKCYYYHSNKIPFEVNCKPGLSSLYSAFAEKITEVKRFDAVNDTLSYNKEAPAYTLNEWKPPPLKEMYSNKIKFKKPTVVIQNKFSKEWFSGPYNYFSTDFLENVLDILTKKGYDIVYIRPTGTRKGYYVDQNEILLFDDHKMINSNFPNVYTLEKFLIKYKNFSYNQMQFALEAGSEKHLTVSGGNACGRGAGRGVWKTDSWLSKLSGAKIYGFNDYQSIIEKIREDW